MSNKVLVLESEKPAAYSLIRAIAKNGYEVTAASHLRINASSVSKYTTLFKICPNIEISYNGFSKWLVEEVKTNEYITVMSFSDKSTQLLSELKNELSAFTYIYQPELKDLDLVLNKKNTLEKAKQAGIDVPASFTYDPDRKINLDNLNFPLVLKPHRKIDWIGGKAFLNKITNHNYVWKKEEFKKKFARILKTTGNFEIQEYIPGVGRGYFAIVHHNKIICDFAHERIREYPVQGGASSFRKAIEVDEIKKVSLPLLNTFSWTGPIMFEYKYNPDKKKYYLMEINGRWWGSLPLAINAGVNMPLIYLNAITGRKNDLLLHYPLGYTSRLLVPHDMMWLLNKLVSFKIKECLSFFKKADSEDIWDKHDKKAFFANIYSNFKQYFHF